MSDLKQLRKIKRRARDETLRYIIRKMSLTDVVKIMNVYEENLVENGCTGDYAAECASELLEEYLSE